MTRAVFKNAAAALLFVLTVIVPMQAHAALMADPQKLYAEMKAAYKKGGEQGWTYYNQEYYLATIFNAGRAYSLQRPNDPAYPALELLTVQIAAALHYDPLINHEAVPWYVREAAAYVERTSQDPVEVANAKMLLKRVNALEDPVSLAQDADEDAAAIEESFPHDTNVQLLRVEADWRGWLITHDASWRSLALQHANAPNFPLGDLPSTWGPAFLNAVLNASHGVAGYTPGDQANAQAIQARVAALPQLQTIAAVHATTEARMLTTLAPADEYFGPTGMSILGIRNELNHVNYMIHYGYRTQESGMAVQIAVSVDDLHKVYPRDRDLPKLLYDVYTTLGKVGTPDAEAARKHIKAVLTVEYQDTSQAQRLLKAQS